MPLFHLPNQQGQVNIQFGVFIWNSDLNTFQHYNSEGTWNNVNICENFTGLDKAGDINDRG